MNIPSQHYKTILEEFNKISQLCNDAKYLEDKLYFFSASFGIINRVMNFHCDPLLVFMHHILQTTHQGFVQRISQFQNPNLISNNIPDIFWDKLYLYFLDLSIATALFHPSLYSCGNGQRACWHNSSTSSG